MNSNEMVMREGKYSALLLKLCVPSVIIMIVTVLYHMADVFFIGQMQDPYKIAAVGLAGPIFTILSGLGTLFGSGGCTVISLALGSRDHEKVRRVSAFCFYGSILFGVIFAAGMLVFMNAICTMLGADSLTMHETKAYLRIIVLFAPITLFSNIFMNLIRGTGAAKESLIANLAGCLINILLDPLFILVFGWGVEGAALATGIGNCCSALVILTYVWRNRNTFSLQISDARPQGKLVGKVFMLGLPLAVSTILMSVTGILMNNLLASYDQIAVAAQSIASRVGQLSSMAAMGICMGMQPAISYNFAARDHERTTDILKKTALVTMIIGILIAVFCVIFRDAILAGFIKDEAVIRVGRVALIANVCMAPVYAIYQMLTTYFQSTGRAGYATACAILDKGVFFIVMMYVLGAGFGMYGIFFSGAAADFLSLAAGVIMVIHVIRLPKEA